MLRELDDWIDVDYTQGVHPLLSTYIQSLMSFQCF
jgi:hypothetical protein